MKVVHVLRKPCSEGTVAANVLRHGTGAVNVDACRVGAGRVDTRHGGGNHSDHIGQLDPEAKGYALPGGRWPANLVLQHLDGCRCEGTKEIRVVGCTANTPHTDRGIMLNGSERTSTVNYATKGRETVAAWSCAEGCPVAALDAQSGVSKSTGGRIGNASGAYTNQGSTGWSGAHRPGDPGFGDVGGASRFFKQFGGGEP